MTFTPDVWAAFAISAIASGIYGAAYLTRPPTLARAAVKTLAVGALAVGAARAGLHPVAVMALTLSAVGDFFLAFDKAWTLALGIVAFLLAQLCFLTGFTVLWLISGDLSPIWPRHVLQGVIAIVAVGSLVWLWRDLKAMTIPVILYIGAISAMAAMAVMLDWRAWPIMLGAFSWLVSDAVLAGELFKLPADAPVRKITTPLVWWTYYGAQALIVIGIFMAIRVMA
ncbi:MAG: lysoplasmalogenase [Hyphomonadaceae bacterium]|nr:lysoplasmalogenase [Hyphomonadaceae bacterium]